tara:strand:- start:205 stop:822 length:618 start_codon:yes stop_codon:yes gene_type:complete
MFLQRLRDLVNGDRDKYTLQELLDHFGSSSIVVALVLVTFITSIPLPPWGGGFETIPGGIISLILAMQGLMGVDKLYLPDFISSIMIDVSIIKDSKYTQNIFDWLEENIEPDRYEWALNVFTEKLMYILIIPHALLMILPIIFTNGPPSQCITLMALSWLVHDGFYFLIMLGLSMCIIIVYAILIAFSAKFLYRTRKTWTFGIWK